MDHGVGGFERRDVILGQPELRDDRSRPPGRQPLGLLRIAGNGRDLMAALDNRFEYRRPDVAGGPSQKYVHSVPES